MTTLKDYLHAIDYKITGGSEYGWECFGPNARYLDCNDSEGAGGDYSVNAVFDAVTQTIYVIEAWDYVNGREYRWINPDYKFSYEDEASGREVDGNESIDGRKYIDLDVAEDILEKITAIVAGEEYDTRVKVPVDFSDEELLQYMKLAHDRDITFNQLVEEALRQAIEEVEAGRLTKDDAQKFVRSRKK
jgi:hypothetical protein